MSLQHALTDLRDAGVHTIALDPVAGKVRWTAPAPLSDALRALVATYKTQILALAGDEPLVTTPDDLMKRGLAVPPNTSDGLIAYRADLDAALRYAGEHDTPTAWRYVCEQRARVASFEDDLFFEISDLIEAAKRQTTGYTGEDRAMVWKPGIDLDLIDSAIATWRMDRAEPEAEMEPTKVGKQSTPQEASPCSTKPTLICPP